MIIRTDIAIHQAVTGLSWCKFRKYENHPEYEWYYAEEEYYAIRRNGHRIYTLIKAKSPDEALRRLLEEENENV